jgi:hypothetical protein
MAFGSDTVLFEAWLLVGLCLQGGASAAADVVSSLPGTSEGDKLGSAAEAIRSLKGQVAELQARNRALADDLFKVASGR